MHLHTGRVIVRQGAFIHAKESQTKMPRQHKLYPLLGLYEIFEKISLVAYKVDLPPAHGEYIRSSGFHTSRHTKEIIPYPVLDNNLNQLLYPHKKLTHRRIRKKGRLVTEFLVQWVSKQMEAPTWENAEELYTGSLIHT